MMHPVQRQMVHSGRALLLVLALTLLVNGCTKPVTLEGKPVDDKAVVDGTRAVYAAEQTLVGITHFLTAGYQSGNIPIKVLDAYLKDIAPVVQAALDEARTSLTLAAKTPGASAQVRLSQALSTLTRVLAVAMDFAQNHGWVKKS